MNSSVEMLPWAFSAPAERVSVGFAVGAAVSENI